MNSGTIFDIPVVYTTRLDEMIILRGDLSVATPKDIIQAISYESKPQYKFTNPITGDKILKRNQNRTYEDTRKLKKNKRIASKHVQRSPGYRLTFKELKAKLNEIKYKPQNDVNETKMDVKSEIETSEQLESKLDVMEIETNSVNCETEVVIKSEIETDINFKGINKLQSLLALCKPLKIVLTDISKDLPKKINKGIKSEILNSSSDSDNDVVFIEEKKLTPISISNMPRKKNLTDTPNNFVINNTNDLKNTLMVVDLQDCVIVIYNLIQKELDSYQINKRYKVTEHKKRKYTEIDKLPVKKCNLVINIIACCWKDRNCYTSLLLDYDKYINIARFIINQSVHSSSELCTNCYALEQNTQAIDITNKPIENETSTNLSVQNSRPSTRNLKLITLALKFKKKSKWTGCPEVANQLNCMNKHICNKLLQFNNTNGETEFYELGLDNIIYSKVIKDFADNSSWLYKTMNQCKNRISFTYKDQNEREIKILPYKHISNMISNETECFLRKSIPMKTFIRNSRGFERDQTFAKYKVRHIRNFMEASYKKSQVLSIVSELRKPQVPTHPVAKRKGSTRSQPDKRKPRLQPEQNIMDEQVSDTVNHIVKDILHRFRNVLLTINADGKVCAALNAPLSSLSQSELGILSEILNHAQIQVDKLGLTPGTCLNPNAAIEVNSAKKTSSISTEFTNSNAFDATDSEKGVEPSNLSLKENCNKKESKKILSNFSTIIANKKREYEMSFRSYLGDTVEPTPKITNVFSLDVTNSINSHVLENQIEDTAVMTETSNVSSTMTSKISTNETSDTTFVDDTGQSTGPRKRKLKTCSIDNEKEPKIRIKTATEIIVDNTTAVRTPDEPCDVEIVEGDPLLDLTPRDVEPDVSNITDDIPLQDIKPELETCKILELAEYDSVPENILIVYADGKMSNDAMFLNP